MNNQNFINEIKNYYNTDQALSELGDMLQSHRLFHKRDDITDFIKQITSRDGDSYTIRETGKFLSDIINELKIQYEIKD